MQKRRRSNVVEYGHADARERLLAPPKSVTGSHLRLMLLYFGNMFTIRIILALQQDGPARMPGGNDC